MERSYKMTEQMVQLDADETEAVTGGGGYISSNGRTEDKTAEASAVRTDSSSRGGYISSNG
jgi:hypothetical protein